MLNSAESPLSHDPFISSLRCFPRPNSVEGIDMLDGWAEIALDHCESDYGRPSRGRLLFKLVILYVVLAVLCHAEYLFRKQGVELEARVETIGEVRGGGKCPQTCVLVRYHYRDPVTARPRFNTVTIPKTLVPAGPEAKIEYIPGEPPISRLKQQARPILISVFFWINATLLSAIAGMIGWIAWEAKHPIPRSSQRRIVLKRGKF